MKALQTQPTVSPTLVHHIQRGHIAIKPNVKVIVEQASDHFILLSFKNF